MLIRVLTIFSMGFAHAAAAQAPSDLARKAMQSYKTTGDGSAPNFPTLINPPAPPAPAAPPAPPAAMASPPIANMPSINPAANQGQQSQKGGSGANAAAGAGLIAAGAAMMMTNPAAGAALLAMGMLAMQQAGQDNNAAGQSGQTAAASLNSTPALTPTATAPPANPAFNTTTGGFSGPMKTAQQALNSAGYNMTPAGLVAPDGTVTPNSAFNSPAGMAKAGMDAATIKEVSKVTSAINDEMSKLNKSTNLAVGEGTGNGPSSSTEGQNNSSGGGSTFELSAGSRKAMVAGKTVMFDGEPIGVRGQNIFDMIHVAYEKKRLRNDFIESDPVMMRAPASAKSK